MSSSNCSFLTCIQVSQEAGEMVWYSHLFKNFPVCYPCSQRLFSIVSEADVFLKFCCFFCDPTDVGNLISGSSAFSKSSLNIWKFSVHVLLKPSLENFKHYFANVKWVQLCDSLKILWHCLPLGLEWKLTFTVLWPLLSFPNLLASVLLPKSPAHHTNESEVAQSCLTLCDPMDYSLPGFSVHGIFQASVLERLAISFSRGSSWPRDQTQVSHIAGRHFTLWATREAHHTGYGLMDISISITLFSDSYAAKAQLWYKKLSRNDKFLKLCPPQIILEYKGIK